MVFGQPMTWMPVFLSIMYCAKTQAFVLESSPPMMTMALMSRALQLTMTLSNCSGFSSFVRPEQIMSKPPVLRYALMMSSVNSMYLLSMRPEGPPRKPYSLDCAFNAFKPS